MKVLKKIVALALFGSLYFTISVCQAPFTNYDPDYVNISSVLHDGDKYKLVYMKRGESGNRIKVKYFGARDFDGTSVPDRFIKWSKGKNIICLSSGGYMDNTQTPVGLTVDNGIEVLADNTILSNLKAKLNIVKYSPVMIHWDVENLDIVMSIE